MVIFTGGILCATSFYNIHCVTEHKINVHTFVEEVWSERVWSGRVWSGKVSPLGFSNDLKASTDSLLLNASTRRQNSFTNTSMLSSWTHFLNCIESGTYTNA